MKISELLKRMEECKNKPYYDSIREYGIHGGEYLYSYIVRAEKNLSYIQIINRIMKSEHSKEDEPIEDICVTTNLEVTIYDGKINTLYQFYHLDKDRWKWIYKMWLDDEEIEIDTTENFYWIGDKNKDIRSWDATAIEVDDGVLIPVDDILGYGDLCSKE